ncbi:MAG TPA: hypothetical protein VFZ11_05565 [Gemmatimonadaceae bacterium]
MRRHARGARWTCLALAAATLLAGAAGGCAARGSAEPGGVRRDPDLVTADELARGGWMNAHTAIAALRPRWLLNRGPDTIYGQMGDVQVLLDGVPIGRPAELLGVPVVDIAYIRFVEPTVAAARWGPRFSHGAIYIATWLGEGEVAEEP